MTAPGKPDVLGVRQPLGQPAPVLDRDDPVLGAVEDEGRGLDPLDLAAGCVKRVAGLRVRLDGRVRRGPLQASREDLLEALGIRLDESVLPLSNTPAWLPPYALEPTQILVNGS